MDSSDSEQIDVGSRDYSNEPLVSVKLGNSLASCAAVS